MRHRSSTDSTQRWRNMQTLGPGHTHRDRATDGHQQRQSVWTCDQVCVCSHQNQEVKLQKMTSPIKDRFTARRKCQPLWKRNRKRHRSPQEAVEQQRWTRSRSWRRQRSDGNQTDVHWGGICSLSTAEPSEPQWFYWISQEQDLISYQYKQ